MRYLLTPLLLFILITASAQYTVETVPNQKLIDNSYVSNPDNILDVATVAQIDTLLKLLEKKTTVQVAVVAIESIGDADIFEFSQKLFTTWGIGQAENDNGLLLLLAKQNRTVRFHTGYGLEGILPDVICKRIEREFMVPEFKDGNYNAGVLAGLQEVNKILTDPTYAEELKKEEAPPSDWSIFVTFLVIFIFPVFVIVFFVKQSRGTFADSEHPKKTPYQELRMKRWPWAIEHIGIPVVIVVLFGISDVENPGTWCFITLYFYFLGSRIHRAVRMKKVIERFKSKKEYQEIVEFIRTQQVYWFFTALLFPLPFVVYFIIQQVRKRTYRNHPRYCKQCQNAMAKLNEKEEDQYLSEGQQMEEKLKSVNYDVWKCSTCDSVEVLFYLNNKSHYEVCPKCKTIAFYQSRNKTITAATYTSSGKGERYYRCKFCNYDKKSTYTIAQLVAASTSSSSSSSSSWSSSGSSSSSNGGSWGGGSSGGGGASSSW